MNTAKNRELRSFYYFSAGSVFDLRLCLAGEYVGNLGLIIKTFEF